MSFFDEATETLPREQLAALQLRKLQTMIAELWGRNDFETAKLNAKSIFFADIRDMDDLANLPFTKKGELMADQAAQAPFGRNLTYPVEAYVRLHQTFGTTGVPFRMVDTHEFCD